MHIDPVLTYLCCTLLVGIGGWLVHHTVDRRVHVDSQRVISEEVFTARLQALEDRLGGRMAAVKVKLEDLEKCTQNIHQRIEKLSS